ncbi:hypothetical protein N9788_00385 [Candidatus Pelagibacter sp.]|nr:hypothetical protein [Candidatus Pelagibacter sp.]
MSAEKIIYKGQNPSILATPELTETKTSVRVDINHLLARARKVKDKENKTNFIFFGLFAVLVLVVGILLSF